MEPTSPDLVIVCLEDHPRAVILLRVARNRAMRMGGRWRAVFVETPGQDGLDPDAQERMLRLLTLAEQMGGETSHITAENYTRAVKTMLEEEKGRVASIIIAHSEQQQRSFLLRRTLPQTVMEQARKRGIPVEGITITGHNYRYSLWERLRFFRPLPILYGLLAVGVAYLCAFALQATLPPALFRINNQNIGLLFMTACAFAASRFGLMPGLIASLTSFLVINYFLTVPHYHIDLSNVTDMLNMGIFLSAAMLISIFTSRTRGFAEKARRRELNTQVLFNLYQVSANASSLTQALEKLHAHIVRTLKMEVAFFLPPAVSPENIVLTFPQDATLSDSDIKAMELCWREMKTTGLGSPSFRDSAWRFNLMLSQSGAIGIIGVKPRSRKQVDVWFGGMMTAIADQVATIIERMELASTMEATRISEEREKLRSMLLSSVSHDLKTPLASIIAALNIYRSHGKQFDPSKRDTLIETALSESERLDSFITNILDMTRLESKKITFKKGWYHPGKILDDVLRRLEYRLRNHSVTLQPPEHNVELYVDRMMIGQVLQNIIDNACKYTPSGTTIEISMVVGVDGGFAYAVRDHGKGIPPEKLEQIFDKYARLQMRDSQVAGTGLGLAICKAVMDGQGGAVKAQNHPEGGAVFTICIPDWRPIS
ncbi:MAG TPA: ATP-binding protein [Rickettsiales bacterium]|nr:ATP-binding protein [Rickettsiales bacterium]